MKEKKRPGRIALWLLFLSLGAWACAPSQPVEEGPAPAPVRAPLPGENFLIYGADAQGVWRRDTRTGADSLIFGSPRGVLYGASSADGRHLAIVVRASDSSFLDLVATDAGTSRRLHAAPAGGQFTLAWSPDDAMLGYGYGRGGGSTPGSGTGIWIADRQGTVHSVGCSASDTFLAWRSAREVIVGDARNVYAVNAGSCATLATLPRSGKSDITVSPNGRRVSFTRMTQVRTTQGSVSMPELYIADYNGANARKIADPQFNPRNASWSPDASKIAFEIQSQQFANVTHVAVHDVATAQISFEARQQPLGMPSDGRPCWSPTGSSLSFQRVFERSSAAQTYRTIQTVVRTVATGRDDVVYEELSSGGGQRVSYLGSGCGWIDASHLLVSTDGGFRVVNVRDRSAFDVTPGRSVLSVRVFP